jgi:phosphoribosyl 1,2-cyclic phosphodiesterase
MKVRFWGTRGSLPVALTASDVRKKIVAALSAANGRQFASSAEIESFTDTLPFSVAGGFGGHSSCVELITGGDEHVICDLGSGARPLGQAKIAEFGPGRPQTYHIFLSHLHWDHLMGLPFFVPIYIPGNRIVIHSCHANAAEAVRLQMSAPCFPVDFSQIGASVEFDLLEPDRPDRPYLIAGLSVTAKRQLHAGDSYGYRFEQEGKAVVYSTDSEHHVEDREERESFVRFFSGADLVVFDAMYCLADAISLKADWGHSSNIVAVELCQEAAVRRLAMFHHEPVYDDEQLSQLLLDTRRFEEISRDGRAPLEVFSAYDGLTMTL